MSNKGKTIVGLFLALIWNMAVIAAAGSDERYIHISFLGKEYTIKTNEVPGGFPESNQHPNSLGNITNALDKYCGSLLPEMSLIRKTQQLTDWYYYQLIRKVSQQLIPKEKDYWGYTYCKWFFLERSGFTPLLCSTENKLLLYVKSNSNIYNIPIKLIEDQQYVCLNYHDYNFDIPLDKESPKIIPNSFTNKGKDFSYLIATMPEFPEEKYVNKRIEFTYKGKLEKYDIKIFPEVKDYFINYPVTDYRFQFNIPLSKVTYASIILPLKKKLEKYRMADGVEYILFLVRNAFAYEADSAIYGREKRFSPEETLAAERSDCEDYAGLFFSLVREVYNIPMVVLSYPDHINVAVALENPKRKTITHNGKAYTICEPTPQKELLYLGQMAKKTSKQPFEVVYEYQPKGN